MGGIRFSGNTNPAGISQNTATSKLTRRVAQPSASVNRPERPVESSLITGGGQTNFISGQETSNDLIDWHGV